MGLASNNNNNNNDSNDNSKDTSTVTDSALPSSISGPILPISNGTNDTEVTAVAADGLYRSRRTITIKVHARGESGRNGFHLLHFLRVLFTSPTRVGKICNILWPLVPVAIVLNCKPSPHVCSTRDTCTD